MSITAVMQLISDTHINDMGNPIFLIHRPLRPHQLALKSPKRAECPKRHIVHQQVDFLGRGDSSSLL